MIQEVEDFLKKSNKMYLVEEISREIVGDDSLASRQVILNALRKLEFHWKTVSSIRVLVVQEYNGKPRTIFKKAYFIKKQR